MLNCFLLALTAGLLTSTAVHMVPNSVLSYSANSNTTSGTNLFSLINNRHKAKTIVANDAGLLLASDIMMENFY